MSRALLRFVLVAAATIGVGLFILGALDVWIASEGACPSWAWPGYMWEPAERLLEPFEHAPIIARHWFAATLALNALIFGGPILLGCRYALLSPPRGSPRHRAPPSSMDLGVGSTAGRSRR